MIEVKSWTNTLRIFATKVHWADLFKAVLYNNYLGEVSAVPWYYLKRKGNSCVTDLTLTMDEILSMMKSNTRNEIRRAIKEECEFAILKSEDEFIPFYNEFCASKGLMDYTSRMRMRKYGDILLTKAMRHGEVLAMHASILDKKSGTALLMYSCSPRLDGCADKKIIGWGNRYLHFKDLEYLKANGYTRYDWCGVCLDPTDARYPIGQFKLGFGGLVTDSWSLRTPVYAVLCSLRDHLIRFRK